MARRAATAVLGVLPAADPRGPTDKVERVKVAPDKAKGQEAGRDAAARRGKPSGNGEARGAPMAVVGAVIALVALTEVLARATGPVARTSVAADGLSAAATAAAASQVPTATGGVTGTQIYKPMVDSAEERVGPALLVAGPDPVATTATGRRTAGRVPEMRDPSGGLAEPVDPETAGPAAPVAAVGPRGTNNADLAVGNCPSAPSGGHVVRDGVGLPDGGRTTPT